MPEIELKFVVPAASQARLTAEVKGKGNSNSDTVQMTAVYFDTPSRRLSTSGVSLRIRHEGDDWVQTTKAPGRGPASRLEHEVRRKHADAQGSGMAPDVALHGDTAAGACLLKALGSGQPAELAQVFRTDVLRRRRMVRTADAEIEIGFDQGEIVAGDRRQPIHEIEFELKAGAPVALFAQARRWVGKYGLWLESRSKAERGDCLSRGEDGVPPHKAGSEGLAEVEHAEREDELLRVLVDAALRQVLANASEVAAGRETPDHVHQLRVGLRRLRTALRAFGGAAPQLAVAEPAVAEVFRALGAWRDAGAIRETIGPRLLDAGAPAVALPHSKEEDLSPATLVRGTRFQLALLLLLEFTTATAPPEAADHRTGTHGDALDAGIAARLSKLHRQVRRDGERFDRLGEEERHRVRKRLKRLRYLAEFMAPRYRRRDVKRYLAALEPAQDALGAHNDAVVAIERYRGIAASDPKAWFAVGWLTARLGNSASTSRKALKAIKRGSGFW